MVATHQKTQQGLKRFLPVTVIVDGPGRNASENPAGIETQKKEAHDLADIMRRNASENPAGIETYHKPPHKQFRDSRNASENPAGIETMDD